MADESDARFEIANVITRTFETIGSNLLPFLLLAMLLAGIPNALTDWWQLSIQADLDTAGLWTAARWWPLLAGAAVLVVSNAVLQASLSRATVLHLAGETPNFADSLGIGLSLFLPLIGIGLLYGLGLVLGLMLLIMPGLFLMTIWAVVVPVFVQEKRGVFESFGRSAALTEGARGRVFLTLLILGVAIYLLGIPAELLGQMLTGSGVPAIIPALISGAVTGVTSMFSVTLQASIYVELRDVKEGVGPSQLEAIFA